MFASNALKLVGASAMAAGMSPLAAYAIVGVGAAGYSPAKYGILTQLFGTERLVRANGMLEGSTIAAILLGVLAGGYLADVSLSVAFGGVIACYATAAAANLLIPNLPPEAAMRTVAPFQLLKAFAANTRRLMRDRDARFSLAGTSLFWGSGTTLRLLLFAWVPFALGISDNQTPANLMGVVSIGIVLGAIAAGLLVKLENVNRALVGGLILGPLVAAMAHVTQLATAAWLLAAIGFCGGFFVVPLNALLQHRGHAMIGAGQALAVQNFCENALMLAFVGLYSAAAARGVAASTSAFAFGVALFLSIGFVGAVRIARTWRGS
jgi:LPLT family lysophospholipid transporter-like MFS transporter